jgi:hypothetical protein
MCGEATLFNLGGERVSTRFEYDTAGRLIGGERQGPWPTYFSVTSGSCEAVPERLFVLLLSPRGDRGIPWSPAVVVAEKPLLGESSIQGRGR